MSRHRQRRGVQTLVATIAWAIPLFAWWMVLTDNRHTDDVVAGAVCALLASAVAVLAGLMGRVRFRPRAAWLARLVKLPGWIVKDTFVVLRAMALRKDGSYERLPVRWPQGEADALAAAAVAEIGGSVAPNLIVIRAEQDAVLVHVLDEEHASPAPLQLLGEER